MNKKKKWPQKPPRNRKVGFQIFLFSPSYPLSLPWYAHCQCEVKGYIKASQASFKIDSLNTITAYLKRDLWQNKKDRQKQNKTVSLCSWHTGRLKQQKNK